MATEAKARYSDAELDEFKKLIEVKINKAQEDLELLKSAYMNDGNNGTEDTSPTFKAFEDNSSGDHGPCYRCLFPEPPPEGQIPTCAEAGVLGAMCGFAGSLQATEVIKELLGIGKRMRPFIFPYLYINF